MWAIHRLWITFIKIWVNGTGLSCNKSQRVNIKLSSKPVQSWAVNYLHLLLVTISQRSMSSFYTWRSQKHKKDWQFDCIFYAMLLGSLHEKAVHKMIVKLTPGLHGLAHQSLWHWHPIRHLNSSSQFMPKSNILSSQRINILSELALQVRTIVFYS